MSKRTLCYNQDYVVREHEFPTRKIHGICLLDEEGRANIYLNIMDPSEVQLEAMKHEIFHLTKNDHYRDRETAEAEALKAEARITMDLIGNDCIIIWGVDEEEIQEG